MLHKKFLLYKSQGKLTLFHVKVLNSMKKKEEAAPSAPSKEEVLLGEIRDLLKK